MLIFEGKEMKRIPRLSQKKAASGWAAGCGDSREREDFAVTGTLQEVVRFVRDFYLEIQYFSGDSYTGKSDGE